MALRSPDFPAGRLEFLLIVLHPHGGQDLLVASVPSWGFVPNWSAKLEYLYTAAMGSGVSTDHAEYHPRRHQLSVLKSDLLRCSRPEGTL